MVLSIKIKEKLQKIKHNHLLMMLICCGLPLLILVIAVYYFGVSRSYLFWGVLLLCLLSHYFMMKGMHKKNLGENKNNTENKNDTEGGCH